MKQISARTALAFQEDAFGAGIVVPVERLPGGRRADAGVRREADAADRAAAPPVAAGEGVVMEQPEIAAAALIGCSTGMAIANLVWGLRWIKRDQLRMHSTYQTTVVVSAIDAVDAKVLADAVTAAVKKGMR